MKNIRFDLFRYQILPIDRFQFSAFTKAVERFKSVQEIIDHKNEIFAEVIRQKTDFGRKDNRTQVISKFLFEKDSFFLLQLAAFRSIKHEKRDFSDEMMDQWPKFYVAIWNDKDKQMIAVQERKEAFQKTVSVKNIIEVVVNTEIFQYGLAAHFQPLFAKEDFWEIVKKHQGKIKEIEFELITPNMSNISGMISDDLKNLAISTNTSRTKIDIEADQEAALTISPYDQNVSSLVDYASVGGGTISVKVENLKKRLKTSDSITSIEIEEVRIIGKQPDEIMAILKDLMS